MSEVPVAVKAQAPPIPMGGVRESTVAQIGPIMGVALTPTGLKEATSQFKPEAPVQAQVETLADDAGKEMVDKMSLVNRARERLQASLKKDGKMYYTDPLDAATEADILKTAQGIAASELGARVDPETPEDYQKRVDTLAQQKKPDVIKARDDFNKTYGKFIARLKDDDGINANGLLLKDENGTALPKDKLENANNRIRLALEKIDPDLATEYFRALRIVDTDGNQIKLADFMKGYVEQAQAEDPNRNEKDLKDEARNIFLKEAIIPTPKNPATPETKAKDENRAPEFKSSAELLSIQESVASEAIDYLSPYIESKDKTVARMAAKHLSQIILAIKAQNMGGTNPLLTDALFSFKRNFINNPSNPIKKNMKRFGNVPGLTRSVQELENPMENEVQMDLAKSGIRQDQDPQKFQVEHDKRFAELYKKIIGEATAFVDQQKPDLKKTPAEYKAAIEQVTQARIMAMSQQVLESARAQCEILLQTQLHVPWPSALNKIFTPGALSDAVTTLYKIKLIQNKPNAEKNTKAFLKDSDVFGHKDNEDLRNIFLSENGGAVRDWVLRFFLGDEKRQRQIAQELQEMGANRLFLKNPGLLANSKSMLTTLAGLLAMVGISSTGVLELGVEVDPGGGRPGGH